MPRVSHSATSRGAPGRSIEAVEGGLASTTHGDSPNPHFVLGVQWHPERSYDISPASRALFDRFIAEATAWVPRPVHTSVA